MSSRITLREARQLYGLLPSGLSRNSDVTYDKIRAIEKGNNDVTLTVCEAHRLAQAVGLEHKDIDWPCTLVYSGDYYNV